MTDTEVERLTVRMVGDSTSVVQMWKEQREAAQEASQVIPRHVEDIEEAYRQGSLGAVEALKELEDELGRIDALEKKRAEQGLLQAPHHARQRQAAGKLAGELMPAAIARNKAELEHNELLERGLAVKRQFATADEKEAAHLKEMTRLYRAGAIDQQTYQRATGIGQEEEEGGGKGMLNLRQMRMLSHSLTSFINAKGVEQQGHAVASAMHAVGYAMGPVGMIAAATLGAIITHSDAAAKSMNKTVGELVDGSKSIEQVASQGGLHQLKEGLKEIEETVNPSSVWGKVVTGWRGMGMTVQDTFTKGFTDPSKMLERMQAADLRGLLDDMEKADARLRAREQDPSFRAIRNIGTTLKAENDIANMREKNKLAEAGLAIAKEDAKFEDVRRKLIASDVGPSAGRARAALTELRQAQTEDQSLALRRTAKGFQDVIDRAGMTTPQIKAYEAGLRDATDAQQDAVEGMGRLADAFKTVGGQITSNDKKLRDWGLTSGEAAAQELERASRAKGVSKENRDKAESMAGLARGQEQLLQRKDLNKELEKYQLNLDGATKAEVAMHGAAKGGIADYAAFVKSALGEADQQVVSLGRKVGAFGLTGPEAAARELERNLGKLKPGDRKLAEDQLAKVRGDERITQLQELTKELEKYSMTVEGASKADMAFAAASEGGMSKELARQKTLLSEAAQVMEASLLPQDKYMREQKRLDELLKENLITEEAHGRALGKAQQQLNGPQQQVQAVAFGSAEALARVNAQRQANRPVQRIVVDNPEQAGREKVAQLARDKMVKLLEQIAAEKDKDKNPVVQLAAAGLAGGIGGGN